MVTCLSRYRIKIKIHNTCHDEHQLRIVTNIFTQFSIRVESSGTIQTQCISSRHWPGTLQLPQYAHAYCALTALERAKRAHIAHLGAVHK